MRTRLLEKKALERKDSNQSESSENSLELQSYLPLPHRERALSDVTDIKLDVSNIKGEEDVFSSANRSVWKQLGNWALAWENLSSVFSTKWVSNQSPQLHRLARKLKFHLYQVYIWYFPKSKQQRRWSVYADVQAGLRLCCWQNPEDRLFSRCSPICFKPNFSSFHAGYFLTASFALCWILSKLIAFPKTFIQNIIRVSNSLDPGQAWRFIRPDLGPNCLQRSPANDKIRC